MHTSIRLPVDVNILHMYISVSFQTEINHMQGSLSVTQSYVNIDTITNCGRRQYQIQLY